MKTAFSEIVIGNTTNVLSIVIVLSADLKYEVMYIDILPQQAIIARL